MKLLIANFVSLFILSFKWPEFNIIFYIPRNFRFSISGVYINNLLVQS
jgi:hypothetical protein